MEGTGLTKLSELFDGVDSCAYQNGADEIFMDSWDVRRRVGDEVPLSFILRPAPPTDIKAQLLSAVEQLKTFNRVGLVSTIMVFTRTTCSGLRKPLPCWIDSSGRNIDSPVDKKEGMQRYPGKNVLISGGGSGIGHAICLRLAAEGANIILIDKDLRVVRPSSKS